MKVEGEVDQILTNPSSASPINNKFSQFGDISISLPPLRSDYFKAILG